MKKFFLLMAVIFILIQIIFVLYVGDEYIFPIDFIPAVNSTYNYYPSESKRFWFITWLLIPLYFLIIFVICFYYGEKSYIGIIKSLVMFLMVFLFCFSGINAGINDGWSGRSASIYRSGLFGFFIVSDPPVFFIFYFFYFFVNGLFFGVKK